MRENASIVGAYLEHQRLAEAESAPERFFMNVALARVLYVHALVATPRLALGRLAPLGRVVGDPRLGGVAVCRSASRSAAHLGTAGAAIPPSVSIRLVGWPPGRTRSIVVVQMGILVLLAVFTADAADRSGRGFAVVYASYQVLQTGLWASVWLRDRRDHPEFGAATGAMWSPWPCRWW